MTRIRVYGGGKGVTDHSKLSNLDFDHAGHTGFASASESDKIIYVNGNSGSDTNGGTSWGDAYATFMKAINSLPSINTKDIEIRIAPKTGGYNEDIDLAGHINVGTITIKAMNKDNEELYDNGTATGGGSNYLDDTSKSWSADQFNGGKIFIYDGTGEGQIRDISDTTATRITVSSNWDTNPDSTSRYVILGLVKVNGTFKNYNLNNFYMYGLSFSVNQSGYAADFTGVNNQYVYYCQFLNPTDDGVHISHTMIKGWYNYIKAKDELNSILHISFAEYPRASLLEAETTGSGTGLLCASRSYVDMWSNAGYTCFKNLNYGIRALASTYVQYGSRCTYLNCNTNYTPSGSDDSAVT